MRRRTFLRVCAGSLVLQCAGAGAQPVTKPLRVGFLTHATPEQSAPLLREFTEGLRELGYVDRRSLVIEPHYGDGTLERLPDLAAAVVRTRVDVIVTGTKPIAAAAKHATATIPLVMIGAVDPVGSGLVRGLAHPGGNITGLCVDASDEMSGKMLELLKELVPGLSRVGVLRQAAYKDPHLETAARRLSVELRTVDVRAPDDLDGAFIDLVRKRVGAVIVRGSLYVHRNRIADLALKHRLPAIHALKEYAEAGLLMSYGANLADLYRRAAGFVDRIAKGEKPGNLPVQQPTKFDLVINLRTAQALGLKISDSLRLRAHATIR